MKRVMSLLILFMTFAPLALVAQTGGKVVVGSGPVIIDGIRSGDPQESIYVRKVGHGPQTIVLVPGNNTSGAIFDGILDGSLERIPQ